MRWPRPVIAVVLIALTVLWSWVAIAQSSPQIQVQVDQDTVGVGDVVTVVMNATGAAGMPGDPRLGSLSGFTLRGQNQSPSQTHISINGSRMDRYTLTVEWALQAQRAGAFTIGPPSVTIGGQRFSGQVVKLHVVPAGQAPPRRSQPQQPQSPFGFSPFDPWKMLIPGFSPFDQGSPSPPPAPTTDPALSLDAPRGDLFFLHATVDKSSAVIGEQVTLSVYGYLDTESASSVNLDERDAIDPQVPDFVRHELVDDAHGVQVGYAAVGGHVWSVQLMARWALFPLKSGELVIGPMRRTMALPRSVAGQRRTSEDLHVHVTEPPLAGRPAGYSLGDVGRFTLAAQVQPRQVEAGGAVGVHVELSGTGNLPATLVPAAREGLEWLPPEVHGELGPAGHDQYGGKRSFDFVVRLKKPGNLDLGSLTLPYWNPEQKRYETARAALGSVQVAAVAGAGPVVEAAEPVLPGLPAQRNKLQGQAERKPFADDSLLFWILGVGAWPLAFGVVTVGRAGARRVRRAWKGRRSSPAADLKERVALAHVACDGKDAREADAAIARALEAATVAHAGVNVRAAVGGEVADRLERAGVARDAATNVAELLRECEAARFSPDATDVVTARDRWIRAQGAIRGMEKRG
jgi:hypothetical protein